MSRPGSDEAAAARMLIRDAQAEFADVPGLVAELAAGERRLAEPLRVALAGTLKSGKSTLLNALVGEEIAPTDATECTRVVTWFTRSPWPNIELIQDGGRHESLPVHRIDGRLQLDLGGVPADRVERLEVGWPSSLLDRYTLIDTPGTSSNSRDVSERTLAFLTPDEGSCPADAVVYLMRSLHESDVGLLRHIQQHRGNGPLGVLGVLSRADETAGGHGMEAARKVSAELRRDTALHGLHRDFTAVSGLLAVRGQTLRQREFVALAALAASPDDVLDAALISPGRFLGEISTENVAASAADRGQLLDSFGLVGVRVAVQLVRAGARDAPALAEALVRHSGLDALRRILDERFGGRHASLKAHSALRTLRAILLRERDRHERHNQHGQRTARLLRAVDRQLADSHPLTELRVLAGLSVLPVPEPTRLALDQVLGGRGIGPCARLGLPDEATNAQLRTAALHALAHWHGQLDEPLLDQPTERAYRTAVRSCEAIVAGTAG